MHHAPVDEGRRRPGLLPRETKDLPLHAIEIFGELVGSRILIRAIRELCNREKVLLIIDQNSAVDCIIQRSRDKGIVKGLSSKLYRLDYVLKTSDVVVGDIVVTSGLGGVFQKGLPVGEVMEVADFPGELFRDVKVRPMVNFSKLEELLVVLRENPL